MNCIRCAKETEDNQVFCNECLKDMERHPVKPGTPIQLPNRENRTVQTRTKFRVANSKWVDRIYRLKLLIKWLVALIILLILALTLCICDILDILPEWINRLLHLSELKEWLKELVH